MEFVLILVLVIFMTYIILRSRKTYSQVDKSLGTQEHAINLMVETNRLLAEILTALKKP